VTPDLADRVAKLLRMVCDRSHDGETLAAAGRLSATCEAYGIDWDAVLRGGNGHDLTREQMAEIYQAGLERGLEMGRQEKAAGNGDWAAAGHSRADEIGERESELQQILNAAARSKADGQLSGWYANFAGDMQERLHDWGTRTFVTERQLVFLDKLRSIVERQGYL
jgi:hypothetical protein